MARICELTGKKLMSGNNVSHSKRRTKRKFYPNIIKKKFYLPKEDKFITLNIAASTLRTINKIGLDEMLNRARISGHYKG